MQQLPNECKVAILLGRYTHSEKDKQDLTSIMIMSDQLDWYLIVVMLFKNKVLPLGLHNVQKLKIRGKIPPHIFEIIRFFAVGILEKNKILIDEFGMIRDALQKNDTPFSPLKGLVLIDYIYNRSSRQMNDIDIMISRKSVDGVRRLMNEMGYFESEIDHQTGRGRPLTRREELTWKVSMYNLPPFVKNVESPYMDSIQVDFTFNIKFDSTDDPCKTFLERTIFSERLGCQVLTDIDMCIHLCCHLYKEAKNIVWIERSVDFNLIKFSDIREFMLVKIDSWDFDDLVDSVIEYQVEEAFYLTFYCLKEIFGDGYEDEVLSRLNIDDKSIISTYGQRDYGETKEYTGGILGRLFDCQMALTVQSVYSQFADHNTTE